MCRYGTSSRWRSWLVNTSRDKLSGVHRKSLGPLAIVNRLSGFGGKAYNV